jgi:beta-glucanase (GH16 family)
MHYYAEIVYKNPIAMKLHKIISWKHQIRQISAALLLVLAFNSGFGADPVIIWSDEFEVDGLPDSTKWLYDVGGDGWGNDEQQFYTEGRLENARVEGGVLIIEARKEGWPPSRNPPNDYTSARLLSKGSGDWLYGRIEIRAKLPAGIGTWPAIWMLPTGNAYGGWPRSGEVDIMEHVGFEMGRVHGSLHSIDHNWTTGTQPTGSTIIEDVDTAFHDYAIDWTPGGISFLIDNTVYFSATNPGTGWEEWPFDQPFHLIMNLAVGGFWGGQQGIDPDIWPQRLEVEYVRVYDLGDTIPLDTDDDQDPNSTDPDDDGDGLSDIEEHGLGTNLLKADTDGDGFSDGDEVSEGTNPLLSGSYPGSDPSALLVNPDFVAGEDPWIVHTNLFSAEGEWLSQVGSWGGAYDVFDYVTAAESEPSIFINYTQGGSPNAEHLLYQEWSFAVQDFFAGDVLRFRGVASSEKSSEGMITQAFIRILDSAFQPLPATVVLDLSSQATAFNLETVIDEGPLNVVQVGFLTNGPQTETASITFTGLEATLNESLTWGGWPIVSGNVDTSPWMGWLYIENDPWIWSYSLGKWIYLPGEFIGVGGSWVYIPSGN